MRLEKCRNHFIIDRKIAIVKDNEAKIWPGPRKDVIARTTVAHGIDKETPSLGDFSRPGFLNQKLPLLGTRRIHPYMLLCGLIPIQNSIVAQGLEKLSRYRKNRFRGNRQTLYWIGQQGRRPRDKLELRSKLFKEKQVVFLGCTGRPWTAEASTRGCAQPG
jgi:hypothetical protein